MFAPSSAARWIWVAPRCLLGPYGSSEAEAGSGGTGGGTGQGPKWGHHTFPDLGVPGARFECPGPPGGRRWGRFEQISRPGARGEGCGLQGACGEARMDLIWTRSRSGDQIWRPRLLVWSVWVGGEGPPGLGGRDGCLPGRN